MSELKQQQQQMWHIHTMEYDLARKKEGNLEICYDVDELLRALCWNKPVTEEKVPHNFTESGIYCS